MARKNKKRDFKEYFAQRKDVMQIYLSEFDAHALYQIIVLPLFWSIFAFVENKKYFAQSCPQKEHGCVKDAHK